MVYAYRKNDELYHHGIRGQKWGERNGPPYPLGSGDHSAAEEKAGWRKSLNKGGTVGIKKKQKSGLLIPKVVKKIYRSLPIAVLPVTAAMVVDDALDTAAAKARDKSDDKRREKLETDEKSGLKLQVKPGTMKEDSKRVNPGYYSAFGGSKNENCTYCSVTYDLRRRGYDVKANDCKPQYFDEVLKKAYKNKYNEIRPIVISDKYVSMFGDVKSIGYKEKKQRISKICEEMLGDGKDKRGVLSIKWKTGFVGHALSYEVQNGKLFIVDSQNGTVYKNPESFLKHVRLDNSLWFAETSNLKVNFKDVKEICR